MKKFTCAVTLMVLTLAICFAPLTAKAAPPNVLLVPGNSNTINGAIGIAQGNATYDTIQVLSTYGGEQGAPGIDITQPASPKLTIKGPQAGNSAINRTGAEVVIAVPITVNAANTKPVTIDGFTISGSITVLPPTTTHDAVNIQNNIINNSVEVTQCTPALPTTSIISQNVINSGAAFCIRVDDGMSNLEISGNQLLITGNGIQIVGSPGGGNSAITINQNDFSKVSGDALDLEANGLVAGTASYDFTNNYWGTVNGPKDDPLTPSFPTDLRLNPTYNVSLQGTTSIVNYSTANISIAPWLTSANSGAQSIAPGTITSGTNGSRYFTTIAAAVDSLAPGDRLDLLKGLFREGMYLPAGATGVMVVGGGNIGSNPLNATILTGPIFVEASGLSSDVPLTIASLRVQGVIGDGITLDGVDYVTLQNVDVVCCEKDGPLFGDGIFIKDACSGIDILSCHITGNAADGIHIDSSSGQSIDTVTVGELDPATPTLISNNGAVGFYADGQNAGNQDQIALNGATISWNGDGTTRADAYFNGVQGKITVNNVTFTSGAGVKESLALDAHTNPTNTYLGTVTLSNLTFHGSPQEACIRLLGQIYGVPPAFKGVMFNAAPVPTVGTQLLLQGVSLTTNGRLDLGDTQFANIQNANFIEMRDIDPAVSSKPCTINVKADLCSYGALDVPARDLVAIEQHIIHRYDDTRCPQIWGQVQYGPILPTINQDQQQQLIQYVNTNGNLNCTLVASYTPVASMKGNTVEFWLDGDSASRVTGIVNSSGTVTVQFPVYLTPGTHYLKAQWSGSGANHQVQPANNIVPTPVGAGVANPTTVWVNPGWTAGTFSPANPGAYHFWGYDAFDNIWDAEAIVATAGTINLQNTGGPYAATTAHTYPIPLNKAKLTIQCDPTQAIPPLPQVQQGADQDVFQISANGITLRNIEIVDTKATNNTAGSMGTAIHLLAGANQNITVSGCAISGFQTAIANDTATISLLLSNNTIKGTNPGGTAVNIVGATLPNVSTNDQFSGNTISDTKGSGSNPVTLLQLNGAFTTTTNPNPLMFSNNILRSTPTASNTVGIYLSNFANNINLGNTIFDGGSDLTINPDGSTTTGCRFKYFIEMDNAIATTGDVMANAVTFNGFVPDGGAVPPVDPISPPSSLNMLMNLERHLYHCVDTPSGVAPFGLITTVRKKIFVVPIAAGLLNQTSLVKALAKPRDEYSTKEAIYLGSNLALNPSPIFDHGTYIQVNWSVKLYGQKFGQTGVGRDTTAGESVIESLEVTNKAADVSINGFDINPIVKPFSVAFNQTGTLQLLNNVVEVPTGVPASEVNINTVTAGSGAVIQGNYFRNQTPPVVDQLLLTLGGVTGVVTCEANTFDGGVMMDGLGGANVAFNQNIITTSNLDGLKIWHSTIGTLTIQGNTFAKCANSGYAGLTIDSSRLNITGKLTVTGNTFTQNNLGLCIAGKWPQITGAGPHLTLDAGTTFTSTVNVPPPAGQLGAQDIVLTISSEAPFTPSQGLVVDARTTPPTFTNAGSNPALLESRIWHVNDDPLNGTVLFPDARKASALTCQAWDGGAVFTTAQNAGGKAITVHLPIQLTAAGGGIVGAQINAGVTATNVPPITATVAPYPPAAPTPSLTYASISPAPTGASGVTVPTWSTLGEWAGTYRVLITYPGDATYQASAFAATIKVLAGNVGSVTLNAVPTNLTADQQSTIQAMAKIIGNNQTYNCTLDSTWSEAPPANATSGDSMGMVNPLGVNNVFTPGTFTGPSAQYTVTAVYNGLTAPPGVAASVVLTVTPGVPVGLLVKPAATTTNPGTATPPFTVIALDAKSNQTDVTPFAIWSYPAGSGGSMTIAPPTFTPTHTGTNTGIGAWILTAGYQTLSATSTVTVQQLATATVSLDVTPKNPVLTVGTDFPFNADAIDNYGNRMGVSDSSTWQTSMDVLQTPVNGKTIRPLSAASRITASYQASPVPAPAISGSTLFTVRDDRCVTTLTLTPANATIRAGTSHPYTLTTNNPGQDVTASTTFTITDGSGNLANDGGSWSGSTYYSKRTGGPWKVTAKYKGITCTATLNVVGGTARQVQIAPAPPVNINYNQMAPGDSRQYTVTAFDQVVNASTNAYTPTPAQITWQISIDNGVTWNAFPYAGHTMNTTTNTYTAGPATPVVQLRAMVDGIISNVATVNVLANYALSFNWTQAGTKQMILGPKAITATGWYPLTSNVNGTQVYIVLATTANSLRASITQWKPTLLATPQAVLINNALYYNWGTAHQLIMSTTNGSLTTTATYNKTLNTTVSSNPSFAPPSNGVGPWLIQHTIILPPSGTGPVTAFTQSWATFTSYIP